MQGVFGTPAYMAPEQIEGKEVTKLADIYALGLIIYEMVTGEHAFPADTPLASAAKRLSDQTLSAKRIVPQLSNVWEQTIIRCLQRDPNARYSSAIDVAKALSDQTLDSFDGSERGVSPPISAKARITPYWWRGKLALRMISLILICLLVGVGFFLWLKPTGKGHSGVQPVHQELTFLGDAYMPAISSDGTFGAYVTSASRNKRKLMLQDLSGSASLELLQADDLGNPRWSPDGSELVLSITESDPKKSGLFVVSRLGGVPRPVGTMLSGACWSPDGSHIS